MIPTDLASRLRLLTQTVVNPVSAVQEIAAELPELQPGQRFVARIEGVLPDGSFRALVGERSVTLALAQPARPGESLELVVTARTPRLIFAENAATAAAVDAATLSRTGRLLGSLLAAQGPPPQPPRIDAAAPLLPAPPAQAATLAAALGRAIAESGLFYESHLASWIAGRHPAEALAREPQARHAAAARAAAPQAAAEETGELASAGAKAAADEPAAPALPEALRTLVKQQLDAAATQHIVWRGEIWPGQPLHWEIRAEDEARQEAGGNEAAEAPAARRWKTRLALELPRLGKVELTVDLAPEKVSLDVTANAVGADVLRRGLGELAAAFAAAGLPPLVATVASHELA
jgi:hypothetical protein